MAESLSCQNTEVEDGKVLLSYWRVETEGDGVIVLFSSSGLSYIMKSKEKA